MGRQHRHADIAEHIGVALIRHGTAQADHIRAEFRAGKGNIRGFFQSLLHGPGARRFLLISVLGHAVSPHHPVKHLNIRLHHVGQPGAHSLGLL